jgi:hypothetical protein
MEHTKGKTSEAVETLHGRTSLSRQRSERDGFSRSRRSDVREMNRQVTFSRARMLT